VTAAYLEMVQCISTLIFIALRQVAAYVPSEISAGDYFRYFNVFCRPEFQIIFTSSAYVLRRFMLVGIAGEKART
jgi:hypothetical protein